MLRGLCIDQKEVESVKSRGAHGRSQLEQIYLEPQIQHSNTRPRSQTITF